MISEEKKVMKKVYYGLVGLYGYGIYTDYDKLSEKIEWANNGMLKEFANREEAENWVLGTHKSMMLKRGVFYSIYPVKDNWFYYTN